MENTLTLGSSIKSLRKEKKIKQKILATKLHITPTYLSLIEHDKEKPSLELIKKIAIEFGISPGEFIIISYERSFGKSFLKHKKREGVSNILQQVILLL